MITRFTIEDFKRLGAATLDLGSAAVFIGPNNSGYHGLADAIAIDAVDSEVVAKLDELLAVAQKAKPNC